MAHLNFYKWISHKIFQMSTRSFINKAVGTVTKGSQAVLQKLNKETKKQS